MNPYDVNIRRLTRQTVYRLGRRWGGSFDIYRDVINVTDPETGKKTKTAEKFRIKRGLILPAQSARKVFQTVAHITQLREFIYGGYFDQTIQGFVWDRNDVGPDFELCQDDWIVFGKKGFKIMKFTAFGSAGIYAAFGKSQDSCGPGSLIWEVEVCDEIQCSEATEGVL